MHIIRVCNNPALLQQVRRFWYEIYVEEMGRFRTSADHNARLLTDEFDERGNLFCVYDDSGITGTVLTTYASQGDLRAHEQFYETKKSPGDHSAAYCITTKLIVRPDHRKSLLSLQLSSCTYEQSLIDGIKIAYINCNKPLIKLYEKMGFKVYGKEKYHEEFGKVYLMKLFLQNINYLQSINSPFSRIYKRVYQVQN